MNLKPLNDLVLIKEELTEERTPGGIILPEKARAKTYRGEVVATGPGARNSDGKLLPMSVKVGDRVVFGKYSERDAELEEGLVMVKAGDILAVVR